MEFIPELKVLFIFVFNLKSIVKKGVFQNLFDFVPQNQFFTGKFGVVKLWQR